jgi:hypothetical protein
MTPHEKFQAMQDLVGKQNIRILRIFENSYSVICGMRIITHGSKKPFSTACAGRGATKDAAIEDDWKLHVTNPPDDGFLALEHDDGTKQFAKWLGDHWHLSDEPYKMFVAS